MVFDLLSRQVTPAEAAAIQIEEPDWRALFEEQCARWPKLPRYLQEDSAFPEVMRQWRKFHWSPVEINGELKKLPAGAVEAIVALAKLEIMPPRSAWNDIPRDGELGAYQRDDHMWVSINQEQWRIAAIEDRVLHLQKGFQSDKEIKQIDLNLAKWDKYIQSAETLLMSLTSLKS